MGKVLIINSVCGIGSTGKICLELAGKMERDGHIVRIAYGRNFKENQENKYTIKIGNKANVYIHYLLSRLFDIHGFASKTATKKFLKQIEAFKPDVIWLHNIHGYYINVELLFDWIKKNPSIEVKWTLHDCWPFTGHCSYFSYAKCEKWMSLCEYCPQKKEYPKSVFVDNSRNNFMRKRKAFCGVHNLTLITPSQWLADLVKQSFLNEYPVEVVYNRIDSKKYRPIESDFREKFGLIEKRIVLGVANYWTEKKGIQDIYELSKVLDKQYVLVIVGLSQKQIKQIAQKTDMVMYSREGKYFIFESVNYGKHGVSKIIAITRTTNIEELVKLYTVADVLVNPTYEDNYPTVNLEAQYCGTPVITYCTGGSIESVQQVCVVQQGCIKQLVECIKMVCDSDEKVKFLRQDI